MESCCSAEHEGGRGGHSRRARRACAGGGEGRHATHVVHVWCKAKARGVAQDGGDAGGGVGTQGAAAVRCVGTQVARGRRGAGAAVLRTRPRGQVQAGQAGISGPVDSRGGREGGAEARDLAVRGHRASRLDGGGRRRHRLSVARRLGCRVASRLRIVSVWVACRRRRGGEGEVRVWARLAAGSGGQRVRPRGKWH